MIKAGYCGKVLRVDLSTGKMLDEPLPREDILRKFVGGWGLGLYYYSEEYEPGRDMRDPKTPLIFMTGPLTGTRAPSATNTTAVSLNAETGYTTGRSHSHGAFGQYLKAAGYDGLIITGHSERPTYLWIADGKVEIHDAKNLVGLDTDQTEDAVKKEMGIAKSGDASVAAIGPAGENACHGALIQNDRHHSFSHSGPGAVMGSKNLKAIGVTGTGQVVVANPDTFKGITREWRETLLKSDMGQFWYLDGKDAAGHRSLWEYNKKEGLISARNFQNVTPKGWLDDMEEVCVLRKKPCPGCPLGCSHEIEMVKGPYAGSIFTPSGGGENLEGSAASVGVYDAARIFYLVDMVDRMGFEAGAIGNAMSVTIEAYERGLITGEDTGGIELRWGDEKLAAEMIRMAANREGKLGQLLALGAPKLAKKIGGEANQLVVHIKGGSMNHHDWRATWGVFLGQIVGGASGWPAPGVSAWAPEPDLGYDTLQDPLTPEDKPLASRKTGMLKFYNDSLGICWCALWGVPKAVNYTTRSIQAVVGWDFTDEEALLVGERCMNLERVCNVRNGLRREDDFDLGPRLLEPPREGKAKGKSIAKYLPRMIDEYYELMGWDQHTGKPLRRTLERLGLEDYAALIWG